jgi:hypothetical protein
MLFSIIAWYGPYLLGGSAKQVIIVLEIGQRTVHSVVWLIDYPVAVSVMLGTVVTDGDGELVEFRIERIGSYSLNTHQS